MQSKEQMPIDCVESVSETGLSPQYPSRSCLATDLTMMVRQLSEFIEVLVLLFDWIIKIGNFARA